jgi:hypothetical protein
LSKKVTYVVRKDGNTEFQGTLEELKLWLSERRISSDDQIRRLGYVVLEGDDLWTLVGDRKELGFDLQFERKSLQKLKVAKRASIFGLLIISTILLASILVTQVIPRYDMMSAVRIAEDKNAEVIHMLEVNHTAATQKLLQIHSAKLEEYDSKIKAHLKFESDLQNQCKQLNAALDTLKTKYAQVAQDAEVLDRNLELVGKELEDSKKEIRSLKSIQFVFEGVTYGMQSQSDVDRANELKFALAGRIQYLKIFEERVFVAKNRTELYENRLNGSRSISDRVIYTGLYNEANQDLKNRESDLNLAKSLCDRQRAELLEYVKAHAY